MGACAGPNSVLIDQTTTLLRYTKVRAVKRLLQLGQGVWCCVPVCDRRENESHENREWVYDPGKEETALFVNL